MAIETVAVISPGDMGHVVGGVIREKGFRVITSLSNRSALSCSRAARSGMEDVKSLRAVMREADVVLSIMPPESALSFAEAAADGVALHARDRDRLALHDRADHARAEHGGVAPLALPGAGQGFAADLRAGLRPPSRAVPGYRHPHPGSSQER